MLLILGTIRIPADRIDRARPAMIAMVRASRAEPGCVGYAYALDLLDHGLVHVIERWIDHAALDRHFASAHIAEWRAQWPDLGISDRSLTLYQGGKERPI